MTIAFQKFYPTGPARLCGMRLRYLIPLRTNLPRYTGRAGACMQDRQKQHRRDPPTWPGLRRAAGRAALARATPPLPRGWPSGTVRIRPESSLSRATCIRAAVLLSTTSLGALTRSFNLFYLKRRSGLVEGRYQGPSHVPPLRGLVFLSGSRPGIQNAVRFRTPHPGEPARSPGMRSPFTI